MCGELRREERGRLLDLAEGGWWGGEAGVASEAADARARVHALRQGRAGAAVEPGAKRWAGAAVAGGLQVCTCGCWGTGVAHSMHDVTDARGLHMHAAA